MNVASQIAHALAEQFYRWELRGRGWAVWPETVRLEPPFRPFEGHYVGAAPDEDDGQIPSFGSRIAKGLVGLFGGSGTKTLPPAEIVEPDAAAAKPEALVELQVALPPDYQPKAEVFEQFLFSIGYSHGPVAFEVIGSAKELVVQVVVGTSDAEQVRRQLKAFFPEAVVTAEEHYLNHTVFGQEDGRLSLIEFGLEREFMVPINDLKAVATDPLVAMCGAMDALAEGEMGVFQVIVEPARSPWAMSMVRAVSLGDGAPFFANDPELVAQTRLKVTRPLFAVVVRIAAFGADDARAWELVRSLAGALRPLGDPQGNQLVPLANNDYDIEAHVIDLVQRTTHRTGMLLNSDELIALAHLPTAAVRTKSLRRVFRRTRPVPVPLTDDTDAVWLGENHHEGDTSDVWLPSDERLSHCHILGGTGTGKSTLLAQMALQDIVAGRGVAVVDPHGDLVDALLPHVPPERLDDVILFDPTDEEYAIAFNPLAGGNAREKDLLASDFIALMRQHTSNWGDQMSSLLGNAVLAFLRSSRGGTLPELRRFLMEPGFRTKFLRTVTDREVVYFWEHDALLANKASLGSIGTRLDNLFWQHSVRNILGQRANRLDFADIMDSGKIFLARLSRGIIQRQNAYLLGGLLVSKFYQTAIARQAKSREARRPFMLLVDEAGEMLTPTISEILVGARKYGLGLTLAHQFLDQLKNDKEIYGAVTGSCRTKICFQVSGDDARKLADEFGGFSAPDLMNLPRLQALVRVGPRDASFNLETFHIPEAERSHADAYSDLLARTRLRYCTPIADIERELGDFATAPRPPDVADPFTKLSKKPKDDGDDPPGEEDEPAPRPPGPPPAPPGSSGGSTAKAPPRKTLKPPTKPVESVEAADPPARPPTSPPPESSVPELPPVAAKPAAKPSEPAVPDDTPSPAAAAPEDESESPPVATKPAQAAAPDDKSSPAPAIEEEEPEAPRRHSEKAEAIKNAIVQAAGGWGFSYQTEQPILGGKGRVDIVLTLGQRQLACEISATTTAEQEVAHLLNCLSAGFTEIVCVCNDTNRRRRIEAQLRAKVGADQQALFDFLTVRQLQVRLADIGQAVQKSEALNLGAKAATAPVTITQDEKESLAKQQLAEIAERKARAKAAKARPPGS